MSVPTIATRPARKQRDTQRKRLYAAEDAAFRHGPHDRIYGDGSVLAVRVGIIERIERDRWVRRHFGRREFRIHDGGGRQGAAAGGYRWIALPRWARKPWVVLHEVAHCLSGSTHENVAGHGWEFAATYLALVQHFLGREAHDQLRAQFKAHRVRYTKPRVLSPERRAVLAARLASYRAVPAPRDFRLDVALARANAA